VGCSLVGKTGETLTVSNMRIDSQEYYDSKDNRTINGSTVYPNNYKESNIRIWLNNNFYNQVFSSTEQLSINTTTVDNGIASTGDFVIYMLAQIQMIRFFFLVIRM
jgi:hypothetical protein